MSDNQNLFPFVCLGKEESYKFYHSLKEAKLHNEHGCFVTLKEKDHYDNTLNFLCGDGIAGFSIEPDGDLCGVHKNPAKAGKEKFMQSIIISALNNGAKKLDCYGKALERIYLAHGFIPVGWTKFIAEESPEFNVKKFGFPPIFALVKGVKNVEDLLSRQSGNKLIKPEQINQSLSEFKDYDSLLSYRDEILQKKESKNCSYDQVVQLIEGKSLT